MSGQRPKKIGGVIDLGCGGPMVENDCYSPNFCVDDEPVIIRAYGLQEGDKVAIESVSGDGGGDMFEPVRNDCGCCLFLTPESPVTVLPLTGVYRLNRCFCTPDVQSPDARIEVEPLHTDIRSFTMACGCNEGSQVSVTSNPDGSVTIVVDGAATTIPASTQVSAVDAGNGTTIVTIDGNSFIVDNGPDVPFVNDAGLPIAEGACLVECADLAAAVAALEAADAATLAAAIAADRVYVDCAGDEVADGEAIATCDDLETVRAALQATIDALPAENFLASAALAGNILNLTLADGTVVPVDLAQFVDMVPDCCITGATVTGTDLTITTGADGAGPIVVDLSALAAAPATTDALGTVELATQAEAGDDGVPGTGGDQVITATVLNEVLDCSDYPLTDLIGAPYDQVVGQPDGTKRRLQRGNRWRENHDGTVTMWGVSLFGANVQQLTINFPVAITNQLSISITHAQRSSTSGLITGPTAEENQIGFPSSFFTGTTFEAFRNDNATTAIGFYWQIEGGIPA